jgi:hypothetical protein
MNRATQTYVPFSRLVDQVAGAVAMGIFVISCCSCELADKHQKAVLDSPSVRRARAAYWAGRGYSFDPTVMTANQMDYAAGWNWPEDWAKHQEERRQADLAEKERKREDWTRRQEERRQADLAEKERKLALLELERQSRIRARLIRPAPKPLPALD